MKKHTFYCSAVPFFLAFFFCRLLNAQAPLTDCEKDRIYLAGKKYFKNDKEYRTGLFGKYLKKEMEASPQAVIEFGKYQKNAKAATVALMTGIALVTAAVVVDDSDQQPKLGLATAGLGLLVVQTPIYWKSKKHFGKAFWLRNKALYK